MVVFAKQKPPANFGLLAFCGIRHILLNHSLFLPTWKLSTRIFLKKQKQKQTLRTSSTHAWRIPLPLFLSVSFSLGLFFLWPLLLHARSSFVGKKREMYEHPVYCLASQVMDLTIREYLPSSFTSPCLFSCLPLSLSAPHLAFSHSNFLTNSILSLFLLAFFFFCLLLVWLSQASNIPPVSPSTSISLPCLFGASGALPVTFYFWFLLLTRAFPVCCDLNAFLLLLLFDFSSSHLSHVMSFLTEVRYRIKPAHGSFGGLN